MLKNQNINLKVIEKVAKALEEINDEVIYVGGAIVSLYATDEGADLPRPTKDIDISVQVSTYSEMDKLRERLATKNIFPAINEKVIYRYSFEDILLDFIPFKETVLGPTNSWLEPGFKHAYPVKIGNVEIKILPVSFYLASKWEAFKSRGTDPRTSNDFEDIVYVLDNNIELKNDLVNTEISTLGFLKKMSRDILAHNSLNEIIECHINPFTAHKRRIKVVKTLEHILKL